MTNPWTTSTHEQRMAKFARINEILRTSPEARELAAHMLRHIAERLRYAAGDPFNHPADLEDIADGME